MRPNGRACVYHQMLVSHELGGAGLIALQLARALQRQGQRSYAWIPGEGPALQKANELGLAVQQYNARRVFSPGRTRSLFGNGQIGLRLWRHGPGLVHVHGPIHYGALRRGLSLSGLKRIVHVHREEDEDGLRWAFQRPPDLIITCAQFLVEQVRRTLPARYQERQRIVAVPNPVAIDRFYPGDKAEAKHRLGVPVAKPLVLMLANLAPHKGQETVIRAMALLKARGVEVVCRLAGVERGGEDAYTAQLRALIRALGVQDQVEFLGFRHDGPDLLRAADFLLLPSTSEGLPLSVLEAQATKVPVLAAPTAGIPEVISHGETGFLIPATGVAGYADCLERLLSDAALYQRIAERAHARTIREYNEQRYGERIGELYQECLGRNGSKRPLGGAGEDTPRAVAGKA